MNNFEYQNPTRIIFGKGSIEKLSKEIKKYGDHVLLVYGGQSLKSSGTYQIITEQLTANHIQYSELGGIKEASRENLYKGIEIAREQHADVIIGIGGGSCIDLAKSIAVGALNYLDMWDVLTGKISYDQLNVLPIGAIVTVAGSGSEMDGNSEIDDLETGEHGSIGSFVKTYPTFSILDPQLTMSCPYTLTAYQAMMIVVQAMEQYVIEIPSSSIQNGMIETVCKSVMDALLVLKKDLNNYDARADIMWASALTTNRILGRGKSAPWMGGPLGSLIGDQLGLNYAQGIAIAWPKYLTVCGTQYPETMRSFALHVMDIEPKNRTDAEIIHLAADKFQSYYKYVGLPVTIKDLVHEEHDLQEFRKGIEELAKRNVISKTDLTKIIELSIG